MRPWTVQHLAWILLLALAASLRLVLLPMPASAQIDVRKLSETVVFIEIVGSDGKRKDHGSGFILGLNGNIITARHVLDKYVETTDTIKIYLRTREGVGYKARKMLCTETNLDMCLLYINSQSLEAANIKNSADLLCAFPKATDSITAAGYPIGDDNPLTVIPGAVIQGGLGTLGKIQMSNAVLPGMSGGPVFDVNGRVLGIVWGAEPAVGFKMFTPLAHGFLLFGTAGISCPFSVAPATQVDAAKLTATNSEQIAASLSQALNKTQTAIAPVVRDFIAAETAFNQRKQDPQLSFDQIAAAANARDYAAIHAGAPTSTMRPITVPLAPTTSVFFQIADQTQRADAKTAIATLKSAIPDNIRSQFRIIDDIELVAASPSKGQVRYFNDADLAAARIVAQNLPSSHLFPLVKVTLPNKIIRNQVEIWFPKPAG